MRFLAGVSGYIKGLSLEERVINWGFGLSLIFWGIAGFFSNIEVTLNSPVRMLITILNMTVGFLLIFRKPLLVNGSMASILISLPSLICGGWIFKLSKPLLLWPGYAEALFLIGGTIALISFISLGRNFSILPTMRQITSGGTFRFIRHPAYFGETLMVVACIVAAEGWLSMLPFLIYVPGIIYRIKEEEELLSQNENYNRYKETVRWRLLPFVW